MKIKHVLLVLCIIAVSAMSVFAAPFMWTAAPRLWTNVSGSKLEATFVKLEGVTVYLQLANGYVSAVPLASLSAEDQQVAKTLPPAQPAGTLIYVPTNASSKTTRSKELDTVIAKASDVVKRYGKGYVVVGRVVLDGPGDPRHVAAQMEIFPDGCFAGEISDVVKPIGFRMHQYIPLDVQLKGRASDVMDIGTIHMKPMPSRDLADLTGKIELEGQNKAASASVQLSVMHGPVNTPHNGTSPRSPGGFPPPIVADIKADGKVSASGFSPMEYYCIVSAPGYVRQSFSVNFRAGKTTDIGVKRLERPQKLALSYVVAKALPFDLSQILQADLSGGDKWKATPDIYGWDLEFKQESGGVFIHYSYAPCYLLDLGKGRIEDFKNVFNTAQLHDQPQHLKMQSGHVYLVNQVHWKRWIVFQVEFK